MTEQEIRALRDPEGSVREWIQQLFPEPVIDTDWASMENELWILWKAEYDKWKPGGTGYYMGLRVDWEYGAAGSIARKQFELIKEAFDFFSDRHEPISRRFDLFCFVEQFLKLGRLRYLTDEERLQITTRLASEASGKCIRQLEAEKGFARQRKVKKSVKQFNRLTRK